MRDSTKTVTITVLIAIALATAALGAAATLPAGNAGAQPLKATVSGPAGPVQVELASSSKSTRSVLPTLSGLRSNSKSGAVLVIPSAQMKPEDTATLIEDMTIMSRIFDKKLSDRNLIPPGRTFWRGWSIDPFDSFFSTDTRTTEAIYLEGFGCLFLVNVDFPLSAPPQDEAAKPKDGTDQVWAETQDQMYNPLAKDAYKQGDRSQKYSSEKVDDLLTTLIRSLKHTGNIRGLKADESVTIMVRGGEITVSLVEKASPLAAEYQRLTGELTSLQPTFLTIRATKQDIDSFAKAELDYDQFRKRILTLAY